MIGDDFGSIKLLKYKYRTGGGGGGGGGGRGDEIIQTFCKIGSL